MKFTETAEVFDSHVGLACPGAALEIRRAGAVLFRRVGGFTAVESSMTDRSPVVEDTVFDLASLTKPLSTAFLAGTMIHAGRMTDRTTIGDVFGDDGDLDWPSAPAGRRAITARSLLLHTAGFQAWLPFARPVLTDSGIEAAGSDCVRLECLRMALGSAPGGPEGRVIYSDVGYIILGMMLERLSGLGLRELFLEVRDVIGAGDSSGFRTIAPFAGPHIADRVAAATAYCPSRLRTLQGEVHDDNAWVLGGAAGHAGLFSTVVGTANLVDAWIDAICGKSPLMGPETARMLAFDDFDDPAGRRTPAFDRPSVSGSNAGDLYPAGTVGHLGFTGTSFWFDRDTGLSIVLLTNRTNPEMYGRVPEIRAMRRQVYDAAWKALA